MANCFSNWLYPFYIPTSKYEGSSFFASSPTLIIICLLIMEYKVVSCDFDLHFPNKWCQASFYVLIGHLYIFFSEICIHIFYPFKKKITHHSFFFFLVGYTFYQLHWIVAQTLYMRVINFFLLYCKNSLSILNTSLLSDIWSTDNFSKFMSCLTLCS